MCIKYPKIALKSKKSQNMKKYAKSSTIVGLCHVFMQLMKKKLPKTDIEHHRAFVRF